MKTVTLREVINKNLRDSEFKKAWEESESQYQTTRQLIKARIEEGLSQRELAKKADTTQAVISRVENMSVNPSIALLDRIAQALGRRLEVRFAS